MYRLLQIYILIFSVFSVAAQQESPVPATNNSTNSNHLELNNNVFNSTSEEKEEEETISLDSLSIDADVEEVKKVKGASADKQRRLKKTETRSLKPVPSYRSESVESEAEEMPAESAVMEDAASPSPADYQMAPGYQEANYGFTYSKQQATQQTTQRSPSPAQQQEMNDAVGYFATNAPNSFEYHYFTYTAGNYDVTRVEHLRQAEKIMPNNSDVHAQMAAYNIIKRDADSADLYIDKMLSSGRLNENTLLYAEDLLLSVPKQGVLITHGFDDTYSAYKKQQADGVREDVTLISLDFLQSDFYRTLLEEDGFKFPEQDVIDVDYLKSFCELNDSKPISISMTTPKEYFLPIQSNLYVTGLVFEYHQEVYNNFERNDALWNTELTKHLVEEAEDEKSKQLSANYLPMLLQLRKVYDQKEEKQKVKEIDKAIDKVSLQCKKYDQVQKLRSSY
ncbi:MAG: hypothetical protein NXI10_12755 [bacterium]|nr:hypothetical protein [bacterium]